MIRAFAFLLALGVALPAWAGAANQCGPASVGLTAAAVVFPASGATGPAQPTQYVTIVNPNVSGVLWINALPGGTAAAATAGSFPLLSQGTSVTLPPLAPISIVGSTAGLAVTCFYQ